jgi:hypothetical protein
LWPPKVGAYVESNEKSQSDDSHADSVQRTGFANRFVDAIPKL